jgi:1,4-dihydroxy-2-naphthoate octaprenyltransferase
MVFIFFGPVAVVGTYYVQAGRFDTAALLSSIPMGLLIVAILVVNNLRDIHTDRAAGKRTLAVRLGERGTRVEFTVCVVLAFLSTFLLWLNTGSFWVMWPWVGASLTAVSLTRKVWTSTGRALNQCLAETGQLTLMFGVLLSLGLLLATPV